MSLALVTCFFDYPPFAMPCFYSKAQNYFKSDDIHIMRFSKPEKELNSLYEKLYYYKIIRGIDYYKQNLLGRYEYILFADATDTNFYREPTGIIEDFKTFDANIVFCGEKCFWPPINEKNLYDNKEKLSDRFYLNSGMYIGYTEKIIQHMETIIKEFRTVYDDQGHWTLEYLLNDDIKVDQMCKLFFSTLDSKNDIIIENDKYILQTNPYMVHDNGPHNYTTLKLANKL